MVLRILLSLLLASRALAQLTTGNDLPFIGGGPSPLLVGLTAYWQLGEADGTTRKDSTVNTLDLTDKNANELRDIVTIGSGVNALVHCQAIHADDCLFHTANAKFNIGAGISFSFSGWFGGGLILDHHILANWDNVTQNSYLLFTSSSEGQQIQFYCIEIGTGTAKHLNVAALSTMQSGGNPVFHHFAFGYDDVNKVMWCQDNNGTRQTLAINGVAGNSAVFTLGNLSSFTSSQGVWIGELGFWRRVLTTADVNTLYHGGRPLPYPFQ